MTSLENFFKLWKLIPLVQKKKAPWFLLLIFFGMILEVFGLGLLFPVVIGLLDVNEVKLIIANHFEFLQVYTKDFTDSTYIYFGLTILVFLYLVKSSYMLYLTHFQYSYLTKVLESNSNKLFSGYLKQEYSYFLNKNSSSIIKLFQIELNYLLSYLSAFSFVITELCMSLAILIFLVTIEPLGAILVALFFGFMSILFYSKIKYQLFSLGKLREETDLKLTKNILETFQAIKEIKLYQNTDFFNTKHKRNNQKKMNAIRRQLVVEQLPRIFLEVVAVFGLSMFIVIIILQETDTKHLISTLTLFVAASFRIIPSLNRILSGLQTMKFMQSSIDSILSEFRTFKSIKKTKSNGERGKALKNSISFEKIDFAYSKDKAQILDNIDLKINIGSSIGIIGGSGAGKTTLLDILIGLLPVENGKIYIDNHLINQDDIAQWQQKIGYVSQTITLVDDTIKNNIAFGCEENKIDNKKLISCIKKAQLNDFILSLKDGLETKVGERGIQLSGGQRQRIGIARALYNDPEVLIFDEATSALDETTEKYFMSAVERFKGEKTIIIVTHRMSTLRFCDNVYELKDGKLSLNKSLLNEIH